MTASTSTYSTRDEEASRYVHSHYNFCRTIDIDATIALVTHLVPDLSSADLRHILRRDILSEDDLPRRLPNQYRTHIT